MSNDAGPLQPRERILTLDIVRGFALLGILIMNMPAFGASFFAEADGSHLWNDPLNRGVEIVRNMLFAGKFNSMFSLLFGIGFTIQLGRMTERAPRQSLLLYGRRLLVLLVLGLVHAMVFWGGDVLHVYAVLGLLLLMMRRLSDRVVIAIILGCVLYSALSGLLWLWLVTPDVLSQRVAIAKAWEASNNLAYGHGSFLDAAREHAREFVFFHAGALRLWSKANFLVQMLTTMLIGFLVGRHGYWRRIPELMPRVRRLQWWALCVGLLCALLFGVGREYLKPTEPSPLRVVVSVAYVLCRLAMMTFYVLTIVRLAEKPIWQARFLPMAAAGRMPLTNYLLQTAICTSLFYGWGAGLWGRVGPAAGLLLAIAIFFVIQVPLSRWWLRRFDYGPLEYVWRMLTYGHRPKGRAPLAAAADGG